MKAKFKTKSYDLIPGGVRQTNRNDGANELGLVLENGESLDELIEEATGCTRVEIIEDEETVIQVYEDYTNFMSVSKYGEQVEVRMYQPNSVQKIAALQALVAEQADTIAAQNEKIAEQDNTIADLEASQVDQDTNIEELGDAIIEMSEIVYE